MVAIMCSKGVITHYSLKLRLTLINVINTTAIMCSRRVNDSYSLKLIKHHFDVNFKLFLKKKLFFSFNFAKSFAVAMHAGWQFLLASSQSLARNLLL